MCYKYHMLSELSFASHPANSEPEAPHFYLWLHGEARKGIHAHLDIRNPFDGLLIATTAIAGRRQVNEAIHSAKQALPRLASMPRSQRAKGLLNIATLLKEAYIELVDTLVMEVGKPRRLAEQEVNRCIDTFTYAAEEARRFCGEQVPLDGLSRGEGYEGYSRREPIGIIFGITPFNFPLNLMAHKVAPALAVGCPIIIKPASNTAVSALILARIISEAGFPDGSVNVLPMRHRDISVLLQNDAIKMLSFTGSADIGWALKRQAWKQKVTLELGGNAGVYVDKTADLNMAAKQLALSAFAFAGQSCISAQRIYVHQHVCDDFLALLTQETKLLNSGNPYHDDVTVGPVIHKAAADRILLCIQEAIAGGAKLILGGQSLKLGKGLLISPTILTNVQESMQVCSREIFAPVVTVSPVQDITIAIKRINTSEFGLQASIFSHDTRIIQQAISQIQCGGIIINDAPSFRSEQMPYGGIKNSGMGREGIHSAMLEMSLEKMIVTRQS
ncbi:MAG: aldehyde dehydrogenase [Proteobacteria bacterium]|nr:MAG: aldehyde dehydrogenase [Pseudomonadota bacterium]